MSVGKKLSEMTLDMDAAILEARQKKNEQPQEPKSPKSAPGQLMAFRNEVEVYQTRIAELERQLSENLPQTELDINLIDQNPEQPRILFDQDELAQLAKDIRDAGGLIQPIVVRPSPVTPGRYQLVAGERRLEASKLNGSTTIPALVKDVTDTKMALLALLENIGRANLTDYEVSRALAKIETKFPSQRVLIEEMRMARATFYRLKTFQSLPDFVLADLDAQPRLLGAVSAQELKLTLDKLGVKGMELLTVLWPEVVAGKITQMSLSGHLMLASKNKPMHQAPDSRDIHKLFLGPEQAGSITKDAKTFSIKIKTHLLTPEHEEKFRELATELYSKK